MRTRTGVSACRRRTPEGPDSWSSVRLLTLARRTVSRFCAHDVQLRSSHVPAWRRGCASAMRQRRFGPMRAAHKSLPADSRGRRHAAHRVPRRGRGAGRRARLRRQRVELLRREPLRAGAAKHREQPHRSDLPSRRFRHLSWPSAVCSHLRLRHRRVAAALPVPIGVTQVLSGLLGHAWLGRRHRANAVHTGQHQRWRYDDTLARAPRTARRRAHNVQRRAAIVLEGAPHALEEGGLQRLR